MTEFKTFDFESVQWLQLHVRHAAGPITIRDVGVRRRMYAWPHTPQIRCAEPALQPGTDVVVRRHAQGPLQQGGEVEAALHAVQEIVLGVRRPVPDPAELGDGHGGEGAQRLAVAPFEGGEEGRLEVALGQEMVVTALGEGVVHRCGRQEGHFEEPVEDDVVLRPLHHGGGECRADVPLGGEVDMAERFGGVEEFDHGDGDAGAPERAGEADHGV